MTLFFAFFLKFFQYIFLIFDSNECQTAPCQQTLNFMHTFVNNREFWLVSENYT